MFDKILYLYSTGFILLLVITSAFNSTKGPSSVLVGLLFAPVAFFLIFTLISRLKHHHPRAKNPPTPLTKLLSQNQAKFDHEINHHLSFTKRFVNQRHPLFLFTLTLFATACLATTVKSVFTYQASLKPISPLSVGQNTK